MAYPEDRRFKAEEVHVCKKLNKKKIDTATLLIFLKSTCDMGLSNLAKKEDMISAIFTFDMRHEDMRDLRGDICNDQLSDVAISCILHAT